MLASFWKYLVRSGLVLSCLVLALGCVVEERVYDRALAAKHEQESESKPDGGDGGAEAGTRASVSEGSDLCPDYCRDALANCKKEDAVYASKATCLATCAYLPDGSETREANTVACRARQARLASSTEPFFYCPAAGPGGAGTREVNCGSSCESFCLLHSALCSSVDGEPVFEQAECMRQCAAIPDAEDFDVDLHHDNDTIQCRLVHLSSAALDPISAELHCPHARPVPAADSPCANPSRDEPRCDEYCRLVQVSCTDERTVYSNEAECLAACEVLPKGTNGDTDVDTIGCRRNHAYTALSDAPLHCSHAGPTGDGHCGTSNCESYCALAEAACPTEFTKEYQDVPGCLLRCETMPGGGADSGYTLESAASGNTIQCRVRRAVEVLGAGGSCRGVISGAPCN